ncbi:MAG: aspartate aminotransferase family protein [Planctomycetales bacterium]|nr:aspartate aminotransferase family protein [Planctomycetales bacterium]
MTTTGLLTAQPVGPSGGATPTAAGQAYLALLDQLRVAFPRPVSDRMHDSYFVFSFLRALDQVDALKSGRPLLGEPGELEYQTAQQSRIQSEPRTPEDVTRQMVGYLEGMMILGHPQTQINVGPSPTIPSIIGGLLPSIYNPNLVSDEASRRVATAEVEAVAITADLLGYDAAGSGGVFTFGGTGTLLYAARIGMEKAFPGTRKRGIRSPAFILCSDKAHYACCTIANWMGLGEDHVVRVATGDDNDIRLDEFEDQLRRIVADGQRIACIVATAGTTDAFGLDDIGGMCRIRDSVVDEFGLDYCPHLHADAVIGWAWSVFRDYDFARNEQGFRHRTVRALAGTNRRVRDLAIADSIGVDYHKTGFAPYVSSAVIFKDRTDLGLMARDAGSTPYLFQSGNYHPGKFTLETTRSGTGPMAALANLRLFGKKGMQSLLGHLVSMAEELRERLEGHAATTVLNGGNFGPVTLFRVYPDGVDTFSMPQAEQTDVAYRDQLRAHNDYNRRIFELIQDEALQGNAVLLSMTECYRETTYGEPVVALKSYIMSPFSGPEHCDSVLRSIAKARAALADRRHP